MKYKLTKTEYGSLPEDLKKEYNIDGEEAVLKIEGEGAPTAEAMAALAKKHDIAEEHRKKAEDRAKQAEARELKLQKDLEKVGSSDEKVKALQEKHAAEIEKLRQEREAEQAEAKRDRDRQMIRETAKGFADQNFTIPGLIADQVAKRLSVEEVGGKPVVRVLDPEGNPSTASLADLQKEFLDNKEYSLIIKANAGSGSGASPSSGGGAARKKLSEMSATEEAAFEKSNPEEYQAALRANA